MKNGNFTKHIIALPHKVTEGGGSRDNAFAILLRTSGADQVIIYRHGWRSRLIGLVVIMSRLLVWRNERIFLHYSTFYSLLGARLLSSAPVRVIIQRILTHAAHRNQIFFEVNDLPHEQAIDLGLRPNQLNKFDKIIFSTEQLNFVFASSEMREYAVKTYNIEGRRAMYMINGAWKPVVRDLPSAKFNDQLNVVYAGTLNEGRQVREMIQAILDTPHKLYLVGQGGEWVLREFNGRGKVEYLGVMPEADASNFAASCDLGLIPYDHSRFYYNICYPTKASFYIASGIPFLSTPLMELSKHFSRPHAFFVHLNNWAEFLSDQKNVEALRCARSELLEAPLNSVLWPELWTAFLLSAADALRESPCR